MATSDSDDFESADEELVAPACPSSKTRNNRTWRNPPASTIDSDSDDDNECMPSSVDATAWITTNHSVQTSGNERKLRSSVSSEETTKTSADARNEKNPSTPANATKKTSDEKEKTALTNSARAEFTRNSEKIIDKVDKEKDERVPEESSAAAISDKREKRQRKSKEAASSGGKKLGSRITEKTAIKPPPVDAASPDDIGKKASDAPVDPPVVEECWEFDERETAEILKGLEGVERVKMPEELRSDKKFKEIFDTDGWEGIDDEKILSGLEEERIGRAAKKMTTDEPSNVGWGSWGSWGVSSLINSATAGVSTLTSRVTHGLTLLDEAMGAPVIEELEKNDLTRDIDAVETDKNIDSTVTQSQGSFGLNDILSGVSSITRLVETTGSKVITGGLGTLETIGKKTMEVLQDGDPGLKRKRAFFASEMEKPILSRILREAKEKAELEEKTLEERQLSRRIHFESLFDDYQGLVHLEALEMLSKQCNMKIQQRLATLDEDEYASVQETLEEVKELCDLGDDDDDESDSDDNLQERLNSACKDLGVSITYEKLDDIWKDTRMYLTEISSEESTITERKVFQRAISTLARFTAFTVERFHKTAELLLIKERRSTVNEADALVQLTRLLTGQIAVAANLFSKWLNDNAKKSDKPDGKFDISAIFIEATNASSYIQDAFRLLVPILQVGAI